MLERLGVDCLSQIIEYCDEKLTIIALINTSKEIMRELTCANLDDSEWSIDNYSNSNSKGIQKIGDLYLPRIFIQLEMFPFMNDFHCDGIQDFIDDWVMYCREMIGEENVVIYSANEFELIVDFDGPLLSDIETIFDPKYFTDHDSQRSDLNNDSKMHFAERDQEGAKYKDLEEMFHDWKNQVPFYVNSQYRINPFRLYDKFVLHFNWFFAGHVRNTNKHHRITSSNRLSIGRIWHSSYDTLSKELRNAIEFFNFDINSYIYYQYEKLYEFSNKKLFSDRRYLAKICLYHIMRNMIPKIMDECEVDIRNVYNSEIVKSIMNYTSWNNYESKNIIKDYLLFKNNILLNYRRALLTERMDFITSSKTSFSHPSFNLISFDTMTTESRIDFIKVFISSIYKSELMISDSIKREYLSHFFLHRDSENIRLIQKSKSHFCLSFHTLHTFTSYSIVKHNLFTFPCYPSCSFSFFQHETPQDEKIFIKHWNGYLDHYLRKVMASHMCCWPLSCLCSCSVCLLTTPCGCYKKDQQWKLEEIAQRKVLRNTIVNAAHCFDIIQFANHRLFPFFDWMQFNSDWKDNIHRNSGDPIVISTYSHVLNNPDF